jgi:hypothetical protein
MRIKILHPRNFTTKFIVGFSLIVSMLGMAIILGVGYAQIRNIDSANLEESDVSTSQPERTIETTVQTVGGENGTPVITLKTTPETIAPGESATIDWEATESEVCAASGAWSGVKNSIGNQNTGALQDSQKYSLTCTNSKGSTTVDTTVTVDSSLTTAPNTSTGSSSDQATSSGGGSSSSSDPGSSSSSAPPADPITPPPAGSPNVAPVVTLSVSPGSMNAGSTATISWSINSNAYPSPTCSASGSWSGSKSTSGSQNVSPGAGSYNYTLVCTSSAGSNSKSGSLTVNAVSTCGSGGSCSSSDVAAHSTQGDCWVIIKYTSSGGNGANGQVYKIASGFFGSSGSHNALPSAPSLSAGSWCGKNISSAFNSKHSGGSRSDGTNSAIWWLTNNGNSLIGPYSGS